MTADVEAIAAGLSAAVKRVVLFNREDGRNRYLWGFERLGSAARSAERLGLLAETSDNIGNRMWHLTPLGLAVRAHLTKETRHAE